MTTRPTARVGASGCSPFPCLPSHIPAANVSSVPQRSPLRYPGGKTWLIPHVRQWLMPHAPAPVVIEPFAGGGTVSLTAVVEGLAHRALMVDLDRDISAFWRSALSHTDALINRILEFEPTPESLQALDGPPAGVVDHGFRTLVLNRTRWGGVMAPGASRIKIGENGRGLWSRWYPSTLVERLRVIGDHADRLSFYEGDGTGLVETLCGMKDARVFIDTPYTAGHKRAGLRLYAHNDIDYPRIFKALQRGTADFLMTHDHSPEILALADECGFAVASVEIKTAHHARTDELLVTREPLFV